MHVRGGGGKVVVHKPAASCPMSAQALFEAAKKGSQHAVASLIDDSGIDVNCTSEDWMNSSYSWHERDCRFGETPLFVAVEAGHESIVTLLIDKGADVNCKTKVRRAAGGQQQADSRCRMAGHHSFLL